ncbi:hypothetical protein OG203_23995 [Nocardia sp. NBC_01499]|uniref:hypothetical protein n=1 Tax=Nocardia sp. NBC_01499 TaxID=2903597 RepID=UPI0038640C64
MTDDRTPAEHMADVASSTLDRLDRICLELEVLSSQLGMLGGFALEYPDLGVDGNYLLAASDGAVRMLLRDTPEEIRTLASRLPIRGLEFGCEAR